MHLPSIGNGLWWLARRRMSAQRLAENRIAVERKIGTFAKPYGGISVEISPRTRTRLPRDPQRPEPSARLGTTNSAAYPRT